jgi:Tol biopolymer transport system component
VVAEYLTTIAIMRGGVMVFKRMNPLLSVAVVIATFMFAISPAQAAFPGKNGRIAFDGATDIFTMNPDGSDVRQLTSFGPNGFAYAQSWSADGRQLVFAATASPSTAPAQLWIMNSDGSGQHQLLNDPSFFDTYPGFSPDGTSIVFERCPFNSNGCELYRIRADGTDLTALINFDLNTDRLDITAEYSPDGETIAFAGFFRDGVLSAIYLMNADGSDIRRITPPEIEAWLPDWSPDGRKIVFSTRSLYPPNTINQETWVVNTNGTELKQVTFPGALHDFFPSWSPDGTSIAFERDAADFSTSGIFVINADGSGLSQKLMVQTLQRRALDSMQPHAGRGAKRRATLIENGGFAPRWGPAPK